MVPLLSFQTSRSSVLVAEMHITKILKSFKGVSYHWQNSVMKPPVSTHKFISCLFHELCLICFPNPEVSFLKLKALRLLVSCRTLVVVSNSSYWQTSPGFYKNISEKDTKLQATEKYFLYLYRNIKPPRVRQKKKSHEQIRLNPHWHLLLRLKLKTISC